MQRRAAAAYATLFVVLATGALATMAVADRPTVTVADPDRRVGVNDTLPLDGHPYTVTDVGAESTGFRWVNDSERQTTTIANGSTLSPADADWPGRTGRYEAIVPNGSEIRYDGRDLVVSIPETTRPASFALRNASGVEVTTIEAGESLRYLNNETTVATVTHDAVTLAWGDPAIVHVPNVSNPDVVTLRQDPDVATILSWDPRVENETVTRADGRRYVVYRESNRTEPFSTYYPSHETNLTEGSTFTYRGATAPSRT